MGKKKDKKKPFSEVSHEDLNEDADDFQVPADADHMAPKQQSKKGKKKKDVDDWEDEIAALSIAEESSQTTGGAGADADISQKPKGKKGKKKKEVDNWEDEVQADIDALSGGVETKETNDQNTTSANAPQAGKTKSKKGKKRRDDDNWEDDIQSEISMLASGETKPENESTADNDKPSDVSQQKLKPQTKKGKKKKELDNWEDDIQNEISMLESGGSVDQPNEDDGKKMDQQKPKGKKGKKKNKEDNWEDEVQNEIAKLEVGESETGKRDDEPSARPAQQKSKTKKGKKKKEADNWEDDVLDEISKIESGDTDLKAEEKEKDNEKKQKKKKPTSKKEEKVIESKPASSKKVESTEKLSDDKPSAPAETDKAEVATSKKKKGKKKNEAEEDKAKKKPNKAIKAMQEALRKRKEEEERLQKEEEERMRKEEEVYQRKLQEVEAARLRKEKKKQDKKDKIQRQKKEGTYLTPKQKEEMRKNEAFIKSLKEQGIEIPPRGEATKRPKYEHKKKQPSRQQKQEKAESSTSPPPAEEKPKKPKVKVEEKVQEESSETGDDWEQMAEGDDEDPHDTAKQVEKRPSSESSEKKEVDAEESSSSEEEDSEDEDLTPREQILRRMEKLREKNERERTTDNLRSPVICVMGHVDTGKTKILDKIRHSNVQDGEAGGITQQIGATNIPVSVIQEQTKMVKNVQQVKVPGLLVIDTPGHESFSNLRSRGSSNCDMAILVVDIMHGLEPQTIESINMLRKKKTPYVVALNKIDRLYEWKSNPKADVITTIENQKQFTNDEFRERVNETIVQFAQQGLNAKLFYENDDPETWISMVPTSAHSGDGMGNLMAYVVQHCQTKLAKRLSYSENLQCTVLEVKAIQGLGTTVDVILTNGRLKYGDTIVLPGVEGPIVTHIKALLMPQPLKELRVKNPYDKFSEIKAAQGVKVLAKELDKALAGTSLLIARRDDEIDILKEEVQAEVDQALRSIKLQEHGVFVQASTLGSLEALLEFLKQSKIPYAGISIGPVHKRDVMKASAMLDKGQTDQWAVILAFDVKVEREAQDLADNLGVKIFTADIIYHLFDAFMQHREDLKRSKQDEYRHLAVFPCKFKIVPNCVFKSRDPIVIGVAIEAGQLRVGTPICVPSKGFLNVGIVASMEFNHKPVEMARKPQEVCIKIDGTPGEAPKMVGRHFEETDVLTSKISRESIDLLKDWFRGEMQKNDWQLVIELKKLFEII